MSVRVIADAPGRLDAVLRRAFPDAPRRELLGLIADGKVRVDGARARKGTRVAAGAAIELVEAPPSPADLRPAPDAGAPLDVVVETPQLVIVAKPAGVPSHPLRPGERATLANAIVARYPECADAGADPREGGLVHRLDTGTTGAIAAARDRATWEAARAAFRDRAVRKDYLALVAARVSHPGECEEPIAHAGRRARVAYTVDALPAHTSWTVSARAGDYSLLSCRAHTGRMHQIRVHLAHAGMPIVGDELYGGPPAPGPLVGHFLHAAHLALLGVDATAPLPAARLDLLRQLGFDEQVK